MRHSGVWYPEGLGTSFDGQVVLRYYYYLYIYMVEGKEERLVANKWEEEEETQ